MGFGQEPQQWQTYPVKPGQAGYEGYPPATPSSAQAAVGYPIAPSGVPNHGTSVDQATFFPAQEREPRFIGATQGHAPILMHCGACGYTGSSALRGKRGALHWLAGACTFGLLLLTPWFQDTAHDCPRCRRQVAVAKIM